MIQLFWFSSVTGLGDSPSSGVSSKMEYGHGPNVDEETSPIDGGDGGGCRRQGRTEFLKAMRMRVARGGV